MTEGTSELPKIPPFKDGVVIESTDHYDLVYGYNPGMKDQVLGQRTFLVPKSRKAEKLLVGFAARNNNVLAARPFGEKETIQAVSYTGPVDLLVNKLRSPTGSTPEKGVAGVPSLQALEAQPTPPPMGK